MAGIKPVAIEEFKAWEAWLAAQSKLAAPPPMPPHAYAKLCSLLVRLYECNTDQATAIKGLQEHHAIMKKQVKQEELGL